LTKVYPANPIGNWDETLSNVFRLEADEACKTTGVTIDVAVATDKRCKKERLFVMLKSVENNQIAIPLNLSKFANFLALKCFNFK
jgi:hypothetical protein